MKNLPFYVFILTPFIASAIVNFTSAWIWIPSLVILSFMWIGSMVKIANGQ